MLSFNTLLLNLIPLIDVTFSTPTGVYTNCACLALPGGGAVRILRFIANCSLERVITPEGDSDNVTVSFGSRMRYVRKLRKFFQDGSLGAAGLGF
jgi:hypothetical protein